MIALRSVVVFFVIFGFSVVGAGVAIKKGFVVVVDAAVVVVVAPDTVSLI